MTLPNWLLRRWRSRSASLWCRIDWLLRHPWLQLLRLRLRLPSLAIVWPRRVMLNRVMLEPDENVSYVQLPRSMLVPAHHGRRSID
jgi:hypothetical protein